MIDDYQSSSDPADASIFNKKDFNNELKLSITYVQGSLFRFLYENL